MVLIHPAINEAKNAVKADPYREINSEAFLESLRGGSPAREKAFNRLVRRTHSPLSSYARRYFRDRDSVEDILQETYLAVHRGLPGFAGRCKLSTWIFSLAHHKVCDKLSEKYRGEEFHSGPADALAELASPDPLPDTLLAQSELVRMVETASAGLPAIYRDVHFLRDFKGLSGEETAGSLGIPISLVRVRLHRARCLIVECIRARFPQAISDNPGR